MHKTLPAAHSLLRARDALESRKALVLANRRFREAPFRGQHIFRGFGCINKLRHGTPLFWLLAKSFLIAHETPSRPVPLAQRSTACQLVLGFDIRPRQRVAIIPFDNHRGDTTLFVRFVRYC
jgi:hypothetical protein